MSRYFTVPVTLMVTVGVPETADLEADRGEAEGIAKTFASKRLSQCTWGHIDSIPTCRRNNPWTAEVDTYETGYPIIMPDDIEDDDLDEEDDDE